MDYIERNKKFNEINRDIIDNKARYEAICVGGIRVDITIINYRGDTFEVVLGDGIGIIDGIHITDIVKK